MFYKSLGVIAVLASLASVPLSTQLGANSIIAFYLVLCAMLIASLASATSGKNFFFPSFILACINILVLNDGTKIQHVASGSDWLYVLSMYGIFVVVSVLSFLFSKRESNPNISVTR
ncbi:hypothetical protein [Pseudoalteromonas xiamenensis]|uniref:Uncharacterized protein n=1 Tax=Pseudoalteromonas xiamenensis TaxID=882626 RepID=A0A975DK68_9GAMM|nr:hypothetical protein [Pseudoalteromonas xiamenensis]QTH73245.1 hypothetical protein J5O05_20915 [Pseudoalteromonas xiamenensis]